MYTTAYDNLVRSSRPTSPSMSRRRNSVGSAAGGSIRTFGQQLSVNTEGYPNVMDRDKQLIMMERRKKEVAREQEFKLKKSDVGYAERRFETEIIQQLGRQDNYQQYGAPPPDMYQNRYQKLYEVQNIYDDAPQQIPTGSLLPAKWRSRKLESFDEEDKHIVKRCVRCILESSYINNAGEFRSRLGFHRGDIRRLYEILCNDTSDWSHYDCASNMWFVINNCIHEIANNNVCHEWGRWFGNVSRRKVEDLYIRLEGPGKILVRYNGRTTEIHSAIPHR